MEIHHRVVTRLPLEELWRDDGTTSRSRGMSLGSDDIQSLLRLKQVEFVVADAGLPLRWISERERNSFWKKEVKTHLAHPNQRVVLDDFPGSYYYFASEWNNLGAGTVIVLEKHH